MAHPRVLYRLFCPVLLFGIASPLLHAQSQANQPPANYRGPDTYGMCAYVIGDTEYYGRSFYTSSYFKSKAEQEVREYATSQAKGSPVRSHCIWSYRETDLATTKEADRRLIGMPGHPAKSVETGWAFHGGTVGATGANGAAMANNSATGTTNNAVNGSQNAYARRTATTGAYGSASNGTSNTGNGVTAATGSTSTTSMSSGTSSITGGAQQSLSDAKNNAVATAAGGMTTATNSAVGALSNGMQNMFHRRQAQPQGQSGTAAPAGNNMPAGQSAVAQPQPPDSGGFGFDGGGAAATGAPGAGGPTAAPANSLEGVVADVAGNDVIINVGSQAGVRSGATFVVMHAQRVVKDPVTGKPLRTVESQVGELKITGVDASSASGSFSGSGVPVVGDKVRAK